jgi:hypothetical protein
LANDHFFYSCDDYFDYFSFSDFKNVIKILMVAAQKLF